MITAEVADVINTVRTSAAGITGEAAAAVEITAAVEAETTGVVIAEAETITEISKNVINIFSKGFKTPGTFYGIRVFYLRLQDGTRSGSGSEACNGACHCIK